MLTLIGENLLRSYAAGPGILVDNGAKLTISGENTETLEVYGAQMEYYSDQGDTSGGFACGFAGIGGQNTSGGAYTYTGEIVINGGKIDAHGFGFGAGIGGGDLRIRRNDYDQRRYRNRHHRRRYAGRLE